MSEYLTLVTVTTHCSVIPYLNVIITIFTLKQIYALTLYSIQIVFDLSGVETAATKWWFEGFMFIAMRRK